MKFIFALAFIAAIVAVSCRKHTSDPVSAESKKNAKAITALLQSHDYKLTKYYSLVPIDYIDTDNVVKSETELWPYVSPWLPDDAYTFSSNGIVTVTQNANKITGNDSATLKRNWSVIPDRDGVRFNFIGHQYQYLKYYLVSYNDTSLVFWANWNNNKVYSEYDVKP